MACTLTKREPCSPEIEEKWREFFPGGTCAYCGAPATHLDHLHPLIIDRLPTGYGTDPSNLVPCCENCNQPKGNMEWREYMESELCPHRGDRNSVLQRISNLERFEEEMRTNENRRIFSPETLRRFAAIAERIEKELLLAQKELEELKNNCD